MARPREPAIGNGVGLVCYTKNCAIPCTNLCAQSSATCAAELAYQQSRTAVDILAKDEDARRLRAQILLLQNEIDDLNERLLEEQERVEEAEANGETWESRALSKAADYADTAAELDTIKAELLSLQTVSAASSKILTQKLALEREMANIKPELEHLRSTTTSNQGLLAEKLALASQLGTTQVELESARQALQQARGKEGRSHLRDADHETEILDLQNELSKAQRELARVEKRAAGEDSKRIKELEKQLAKETREREKAESMATSAPDAVKSIKEELETERTARSRLEKEFKKAQQTWDADRALLDDKLNQFRTKLRSTKEKLREVEADLAEVRNEAVAIPPSKNARKRSAAQMDPDTAIGTPGDAAPAKRSKRATSILGEKSNFSITPFLNKQTSVIPEDVQEAGSDEVVASIEVSASPSIAASKRTTQPLAESSPGKSNLKVKVAAVDRPSAKISLVSVPEEDEENEVPIDATAANSVTAASKLTVSKKPKLSLKPRKTLDSFASFREASLPPQPLQQKKKKRKLGTGAKTLFDEDDDDDDNATSAPAFKSLGGPRPFGGLGAGFKRLGTLGGKSKGSLMVAEGGFTFSPLKRNPRAGSVQPGA